MEYFQAEKLDKVTGYRIRKVYSTGEHYHRDGEEGVAIGFIFKHNILNHIIIWDDTLYNLVDRFLIEISDEKITIDASKDLLDNLKRTIERYPNLKMYS